MKLINLKTGISALIVTMALLSSFTQADTMADESRWLKQIKMGFHQQMDNHHNVSAAMSEDAVNLSVGGFKSVTAMLSGRKSSERKIRPNRFEVSADVDRDVFHFNVGMRF